MLGKLTKAEQKRLADLRRQAEIADKKHTMAMYWFFGSMAWYFVFFLGLMAGNSLGALMALTSAIICFQINAHYDRQAKRELDGAIEGMEDMMKQKVIKFAQKHPEKVLEILRKGKIEVKDIDDGRDS